MQRGQVFCQNGSWYVGYDQYELKAGRIVRRRDCERLARYCDDYRSKKDVLPPVDEILFPVNSGAAHPESSLTLAEFVEKRYLPGREKKLRPSTLKGYRDIFKNHIETNVGRIRMRDFHTQDAQHLFDAMAEKTPGLSKSEESGENPVPVIPILRHALDQHRMRHPGGSYISAGDRRGAPLDLDNLSRRVLSPKLDGGWKGWRGFRRGLATNLYRLGVPPKVIQEILRHADVSTTETHYIVVDHTETKVAMKKLERAVGKERASAKRRSVSKIKKKQVRAHSSVG